MKDPRDTHMQDAFTGIGSDTELAPKHSYIILVISEVF
jgi:hypothetical protein